MPNLNAKPESQEERHREFLLDPPEVAVFMACCIIVNELRGLERALKTSEINEPVFIDKSQILIQKLAKAAAGTERFDLIMPVLDDGHFSPFFWRWFNWWEDYFRGLSPSEIGEIERLGRELRLEVNDFRPKHNWTTYRRTPGFGSPVPSSH